MEVNKELLKKLRKDAKISQERAAELMNVETRTVSRFENGKTKMNLWQFKAYLEALGVSTEDYWMLFMSTEEYGDYKFYKRLKRLMRDRQYDEIRKLLEANKNMMETKHTIFSRYLEYLRIDLDKELPPEEKLRQLRELMKKSRKDFNENHIADYRLTADEISIMSSIASLVFRTGEHDKAIGIVEALIASRETSETTEEDREKVFPVLYANLSTMLGKAERYKEALKKSEEGLVLCKEYSNFRWVPNLLYNKACSLLKLGEEKAMYLLCLVCTGGKILQHIFLNLALENINMRLEKVNT